MNIKILWVLLFLYPSLALTNSYNTDAENLEHLRNIYDNTLKYQQKLIQKGRHVEHMFNMPFDEYVMRIESFCRKLDNQRLYQDRPSRYPDSFLSVDIDSGGKGYYLGNSKNDAYGIVWGSALYKMKSPKRKFEQKMYLNLHWRSDLGKLIIQFEPNAMVILFENDYGDWQTSHVVEGNLKKTRSCGFIDNFSGKSLNSEEAFERFIR